MNIELLAFDSMGVRSQATFVETPDLSIIIDPAVSLAPKRFSLPPHEEEVKQLLRLAMTIERKAYEADVIVITHYHYDHHDPGKFISLEIYRGKLVIIKDPQKHINVSQRIRASRFLKLIKPLIKRIETADSRRFKINNTEIMFSKPLPHGANPRLGYIVETLIKHGDESVLFSSDVEGPSLESQAEFILRSKPNTAIIDGPMIYLLGYKYSRENMEFAMRVLGKILENQSITMILDHHFTRDLKCLEYIEHLRRRAEKTGSKVMTAAEFMNREPLFLEARRYELYREKPVSGLELLKRKSLNDLYK